MLQDLCEDVEFESIRSLEKQSEDTVDCMSYRRISKILHYSTLGNFSTIKHSPKHHVQLATRTGIHKKRDAASVSMT